MQFTTPQQPVPPGAAEKPARPRWLIPVVAGAALVFVCCVGSVVVVATSTDDPDGTADATEAAAPTPSTGPDRDVADGTSEPDGEPAPDPEPDSEPEPEPVGFGAGVWEIGAEIPPATYVTDVPAGAFSSCYWARLSGFSGDFDDIIANGNLNAGARGRITLAESDSGVELSGDCTWVEASESPTADPGDAVGEGVWAVGDEVEPGTYTTDVPEGGALDSCYWARLSGFSGDFDDIIANGNVDAGSRGRVELSSSDTGIEFSGDCTWMRN